MLDFLGFLKVLGAATHIDVEAAVADGGCTLSFDGKFELTFEFIESKKSLYIFSPVLKLPPEGHTREAVFQTLLQIHLFGVATSDCYFGVDPNLGRVILFKTLSLDHLNEQNSLSHVEVMVNEVEKWQRALLELVLRVKPANSKSNAGDNLGVNPEIMGLMGRV